MQEHCQCRDCQRASGGGHADLLGFLASKFQLTGELKIHDVKAASGAVVSRGFCPSCGNPILLLSSGFESLAFVTAGSLDDPGLFRPEMTIFASRGHPWDRPSPHLPVFPAARPSS